MVRLGKPHVHMMGSDKAAIQRRFTTARPGIPNRMTTSRWHVRHAGGTAARVVSWIGATFALIEVTYILLILFGANPVNAFFRFIQSLAEPLALFFPGLFQLADEKLELILNYGLAAVFWLVVAGLIARVVAR